MPSRRKTSALSLCEDRHSIQAYFDKFLHADVERPGDPRPGASSISWTRSICTDDKLVVSIVVSPRTTSRKSRGGTWFSLDEYWTDESPFVKGEGVKFDCFPFGSTKSRWIPRFITCSGFRAGFQIASSPLLCREKARRRSGYSLASARITLSLPTTFSR